MAGDLRSTVSAAAFYKYRVPAHNFQEYNAYLERKAAKTSARILPNLVKEQFTRVFKDAVFCNKSFKSE